MKDLVYKLKRISAGINKSQDGENRRERIAYLIGFIEGLPEQETCPAPEEKPYSPQ